MNNKVREQQYGNRYQVLYIPPLSTIAESDFHACQERITSGDHLRVLRSTTESGSREVEGREGGEHAVEWPATVADDSAPPPPPGNGGGGGGGGVNEGDWSYAEPRRADGEREEEEQEMEERDRWGAVVGQAHGDGMLQGK